MGNTAQGASPDALGAKSSGLGGLSDAQQQLRRDGSRSEEKGVDAWADYDAPDNGFELDSAEGKKALCELRQEVPPEVEAANPRLADFICEAILRFRRGDMESSKVRLKNYISWRKKYLGGWEEQAIESDAQMSRVLQSGLIRLVRNVDSQGRTAIILKLKRNNPAETSALEVLRTWHYMIMRALQKPQVQSNGIIFIGDVGGATFANLDIRIPKAIFGAISKNVPLRVYKICMIRPFMLMRILLPIVKAFMSEKVRKRLVVMPDPGDKKDGLAKYFDLSKLPKDVEGTNEDYDFEEMLKQWSEEEKEKTKQSETKDGIVDNKSNDSGSDPAPKKAGSSSD
mmetsp:Transcript_10315/g.25249  ORF Transcript_10315/g.25249 Transcript_10315/m.25249 type:complete len:341 (-) Transcript_10315:89-1111(-)|eukprot:CAMPEP_0114506628 /NCGR_PEP_ID=MMETSP0109-20121206/11528_1 /TAXON_ID=29199 /ORGANISM="Chlorarachnion reptans, Strain CCCM449" /LENGTH=340 /DNA_ID=CAMNT_0001685227 /DNA_START=146 /DNA_END=1168 /DNA_ORIENTATION=-